MGPPSVGVLKIARRFRIAFPVLLLFGYSGWAQAQAVPVKPESAADNTAEISLGQSAVPLYGPWKFTVGDFAGRSSHPCAVVDRWQMAAHGASRWMAVSEDVSSFALRSPWLRRVGC